MTESDSLFKEAFQRSEADEKAETEVGLNGFSDKSREQMEGSWNGQIVNAGKKLDEKDVSRGDPGGSNSTSFLLD